MRVVRANIVFEFEIDKDIVLSSGNGVKKVQTEFNAKSQIINLPPITPPNAPRIIITFNNVLVKICQNRFEYIIEIPNHIQEDPSLVFDYILKLIKSLNPYLDPNEKGYNWCGVVAFNEFPCNEYKNNLDAMAPIFDKMINIDRGSRDLASFQLQFGFNEEGLYKNIALAGYDKVNVQLPPPQLSKPGDMFILDMNSVGDIEETGISIVVDINNKPYEKHSDAIAEFSKIMTICKDTIDNIVDITNLRGVLCD